MSDRMDRACDALRRVRGDLSSQAFVDLLHQHGYPAKLSRQRLARIEQGTARLTPATWNAIADALVRAGYTTEDVAELRPDEFIIEPLPTVTPQVRRQQWTRLVDQISRTRWWLHPTVLLDRVVGRGWRHNYGQLFDEHGINREKYREHTRQRLLDTEAHVPQGNDAIEVDSTSVLDVHVDKVALFVLTAHLHNTGDVPWRNRLLYRLGPPVSSSLPFTPAVLPVPDTLPGDECEVFIPGRAQWFPNLATVSYVMVFGDCTPCLPGRLRCSVDTRATGEFDRTLPLPPKID